MHHSGGDRKLCEVTRSLIESNENLFHRHSMELLGDLVQVCAGTYCSTGVVLVETEIASCTDSKVHSRTQDAQISEI